MFVQHAQSLSRRDTTLCISLTSLDELWPVLKLQHSTFITQSCTTPTTCQYANTPTLFSNKCLLFCSYACCRCITIMQEIMPYTGHWPSLNHITPMQLLKQSYCNHCLLLKHLYNLSASRTCISYGLMTLMHVYKQAVNSYGVAKGSHLQQGAK